MAATGYSSELTRLRLASTGQPLRAGKLVGRGGQGSVYEASGAGKVSGAGVAIKIYTPEELGRRGMELQVKLHCMISRPPGNPTAGYQHESLAWPTDLVLDSRGHFLGFVMPLMDLSHSAPLHQIINPSERNHQDPASMGLPGWLGAFNEWRRLVRVAANIAASTSSLHKAGYVVGDFNESNIFVTDRGLITIIDSDSMQVLGPNGQLFLCPVGKPEYTAPEVTENVRDRHADEFALAVHVFTLLMEGRHPFSGIWNGRGEKPAQLQLARQGIYCLSEDKQLTLPKRAPDPTVLPTPLRNMFDAAFRAGVSDPAARPSAEQWQRALAELEKQLVDCTVRAQHQYPNHLHTCPWCSRDRTRPKPRTRSQQRPLSPAVPGGSGSRAGTGRVFPLPPAPRTPGHLNASRWIGPPRMPPKRRRWKAAGLIVLGLMLLDVLVENDNDTRSGSVTPTQEIGQIPVEAQASSLALSPDGKRLYVTHNFSSSVSVIDTVTSSVIETVAVGEGPEAIATSPDGGTVYILETVPTQ